MIKPILVSILLLFALAHGYAAANSGYEPSKVVYDISTGDPEELGHLLDRAALLQDIYGNDPFDASIVLVVHEDAIPHLVATESGNALLRRARDLVMGEVIEIRLCGASARLQGYDASHFPSYVSIVPMADAEIVQLQLQGYAYLR